MYRSLKHENSKFALEFTYLLFFFPEDNFCNVYLMLFSFNTIMTLNYLLGVISQPNLTCD